MELKELQASIEGKFAEWATAIEKAREELKNMGSVQAETKTDIEGLKLDLDALKLAFEKADKKDDEKHPTLQSVFDENESYQRLVKDGRGTAVVQFKSFADLERKAVITSSAVGSATSGVLMFERDPGVEKLARRRLFIRDVLPAVPTTANAIDYVKISSAPMSPTMQTEGSAKQESELNFSTETANVRTLAHWIPATKQILADFAELESIIRDELLYSYRKVEEEQILSGAGTGQNLNGLVTQATSFTTSLLGAAYTKIDQLRRVIQQIDTADEVPVSWFALNPIDFADIELTKVPQQANYGGPYIVGNPLGAVIPQLWRRTIIETNALTSGTFLAGNSQGAKIRDREGVNVQISTEHDDYFTKNKVAILCEGRLTLVVRRPASFITGTFATSP